MEKKMDTNVEAGNDHSHRLASSSDGENRRERENCRGDSNCPQELHADENVKIQKSNSGETTVDESGKRSTARRSSRDYSNSDRSSSCSENISKDGGQRSSKHRSNHRRSERRSKDDRICNRSKSSERKTQKKEKVDTRRRRSSSSSSSKFRSRSRSRSRSRTMSRRSRYNRRSRERSESQQEYCSSKFKDNYRKVLPQYDSYKYQVPNRTIMIRELASHLTEVDIGQEVVKSGFVAKDIRLARDRTTGESRGFAFLEFNSIEDSVKWMDMKQGLLLLHDQFHASVIYSIPKVSNVMIDWTCEQCYSCNFKRREFCYKCNTRRTQETVPDPCDDDETSVQPTTRVVLSNLDILTTEEGVLQSLQSKPRTKSLPIKSVKIAREPGSSMSKGKCYVETNNIADAHILFNIFSQENFKIDGRTVLVSYGKTDNRSELAKNSNVAAAALAAAQWTNSSSAEVSGPPCTHVQTKNDAEKMAKYYAQLYAKTQEEFSTYFDYYRNYYEQEILKDTVTVNELTESKSYNSSCCKRQYIPKPSRGQNMKNSVGLQPTFDWSFEQTIGAQQDPKSCHYDETNGYYFDPNSGLYYDATTQYYYDAERQEFLYWSPYEQNYCVVNTPNIGYDYNANGCADSHKVQNGVKLEKTEEAKQISKKMEKWAKSLNQKKDTLKQTEPRPSMHDEASSSSTACKNPSIIVENEKLLYAYTTDDNNTSTLQPISNETNKIGPEDSSVCLDDIMKFKSDSKKSDLVDENKLACLVCKRRFQSLDVLQKHITMSNLHKKNLEALQQDLHKVPSESSIPVTTLTYRDRAKERRINMGSDKSISKNMLKDLYLREKTKSNSPIMEEPASCSTKHGNNVGNRMLQKMGWQEGQGLGRNNQGQAERRFGTYGLGVPVPKIADEKLDSKTKARKITLARYEELQ